MSATPTGAQTCNLVAPSIGNKLKLLGGLLGIIIGTVIFFLTPPQGLTEQAIKGLGIFTCAVIYWIFEVLPDYITAVLMCTLWVVLKIVPFSTAFASFSNDTIWLLISALIMGGAVAKSGLLKRATLFIIGFFPRNFKGQTLALLVAGTIITPLIPSATAKVAIVAPFAKSIAKTMGYKNHSRGAGGMFASIFVGLGVLYPLFLSASIFGYLMRGMLPKVIQDQFTWSAWFISILPWGVVIFIGSYYVIQLLYKPNNEKPLSQDYIKQQVAHLSPLSKDEKLTLLVLVISLLFWMTERLHGISAALVAILAMCALIGFKIFDRSDFRAAIPWDTIIFMAGIFNLATVFPYLQIDKWIATLIGPYISLLLANVYIFIIFMAVSQYLIRFVLISQAATLTIFVVLITPLAIQAGINPWVPAIITLVSVNVWNVIYQNTTFLAAFYAAEDLVNFKQMVPLSIAYMALSIVGLIACVPLWKVLGLIP